MVISVSAWADGDNPECLGTACGAPKEQGGGGGGACVDGVCSGGGCSVWVAYTDDGVTLAYTDDADGDGIGDARDNCPFASNRDQLDGDGDAVGNSCDNCAAASNFAQFDTDGDGVGDGCDSDLDGDDALNELDNCPSIANHDQGNLDGDPFGNVCDADDDGDGFLDVADLCPGLAHTPNEVLVDERCNLDSDSDGLSDSFDNCLGQANPTQLDSDLDGLGDACDHDRDNDGIANGNDNCAANMNRGQWDGDGDGLGDACDPKYCVVVDPQNKADCLDPNGPFRVHAGGTMALRRGQRLVLPLFANREGATLTYVWAVAKRPAGSREAIAHPVGTATALVRWQYAARGPAPTFTADVDGEYRLQLQATLTSPERAYPDALTSVSELAMTATPEGAPGAMGCSVSSGVGLLWAAALALAMALTSALRLRATS